MAGISRLLRPLLLGGPRRFPYRRSGAGLLPARPHRDHRCRSLWRRPHPLGSRQSVECLPAQDVTVALCATCRAPPAGGSISDEHTSALQSLILISSAFFCL